MSCNAGSMTTMGNKQRNLRFHHQPFRHRVAHRSWPSVKVQILEYCLSSPLPGRFRAAFFFFLPTGVHLRETFDMLVDSLSTEQMTDPGPSSTCKNNTMSFCSVSAKSLLLEIFFCQKIYA